MYKCVVGSILESVEFIDCNHAHEAGGDMIEEDVKEGVQKDSGTNEGDNVLRPEEAYKIVESENFKQAQELSI